MKLTHTEQKLLDYLRNKSAPVELLPDVIAMQTDLMYSRSMIYDYLNRLIEKGYVKKKYNSYILS